jgi:hypothetical protein
MGALLVVSEAEMPLATVHSKAAAARNCGHNPQTLSVEVIVQL